MNVDVAYFLNSKEVTLGMVVRDHRGIITHCAVKRIGSVYLPLQAKLEAILFGTEECKHNNMSLLCIESDLFIDIKEIEIGLESRSEWGGIILNILSLSEALTCHSFRHIRRTANACAHNMAKLSNVVKDYKVWRNELPLIFCNPDIIQN
ncbi:hypothetical protein CRYUN_Cryun36dG0044600 [Craigia yunnanensis]